MNTLLPEVVNREDERRLAAAGMEHSQFDAWTKSVSSSIGEQKRRDQAVPESTLV